jgi:hypothetical protein
MPMRNREADQAAEDHRRDMSFAIGCAAAIALVAVVVLIVYLWTL